jgi:hypothetical protein
LNLVNGNIVNESIRDDINKLIKMFSDYLEV